MDLIQMLTTCDDILYEISPILFLNDCVSLFAVNKFMYNKTSIWNYIIAQKLKDTRCEGCDKHILSKGIVLDLGVLDAMCPSCNEFLEIDRFMFGCSEKCLKENLYWSIDFHSNAMDMHDECSRCGSGLLDSFEFDKLLIKTIEDRMCCRNNKAKAIPKSRIYDKTKLKLLKEKRKIELTTAIKAAGLIRRSDSKLCDNYIFTGEPSLDSVVKRLCEVKYLFDYCGMSEEIRKVKKSNKTRENVFDIAEVNILRKIGAYPSTFPWMKH
jgi:hypothetical protein